MHVRSKIAIVCLVAAISLQGANLDYFGSQADAIVVGSVTSDTVTGDEVSFTIRVARVLKGDVRETTVKVVHPWEAPGGLIKLVGPSRGPGQTFDPPIWGMWFLTRGVDGAWVSRHALPLGLTVLGLFVPVAAERPNGPFSYGAGASLNDALVYEAAAGFQLEANQNRAWWILEALGAFDRMDTEAVRTVLRAYAASENLKLRTVALAGSLERSIPGAIPTLAALLPSLTDDPNKSLVVSALRDSWRDSTSASIQQLISFLPGVTDGSVRAAAVRALAAIHTIDTLPFLASLLTSDDATEQVQAVYGLSAFANACPMQTQMPNNTTSGAYLQCDAPGPYKTTQTSVNFAFPAISAARLAPLVSFWQGWWSARPELHLR